MKVRTDAKRDEILEDAGAVFLELGYERASMAEIAARVGGSKATLYGYFPSKEALFLAFIQRRADEYVLPALAALEEETANEDVRSALRRFGEQFLAFIVTEEAVATYRIIISEAAHSDIAAAFLDAGPKRVNEALTRYLSKAMSRGELRKADASVAALHFIALLTHGEMSQHYFMREFPTITRVQIKRIVERVLDAFLNGYYP